MARAERAALRESPRSTKLEDKTNFLLLECSQVWESFNTLCAFRFFTFIRSHSLFCQESMSQFDDPPPCMLVCGPIRNRPMLHGYRVPGYLVLLVVGFTGIDTGTCPVFGKVETPTIPRIEPTTFRLILSILCLFLFCVMVTWMNLLCNPNLKSRMTGLCICI